MQTWNKFFMKRYTVMKMCHQYLYYKYVTKTMQWAKVEKSKENTVDIIS